MFVKPANLGSSVGISKVKNCEELAPALEFAGEFDRKILVERGITGREFECSVLGNRDPIAAIPCEILPSREFYDYEDKYLLGTSKTVLPADLTPEQTREVQRLAVACYQGGSLRGHGAGGFSARNRDRQILYQRAQHHSRLYVHQHVSENVGSGGGALRGADRPADRSGARTASPSAKATRFHR